MKKIRSRVRVEGPLASFEDLAQDFDRLFPNRPEIERLELLSLKPMLQDVRGRRILDCAAGTGLHALGLARMGYKTSASDIAPRMARATRRAARAEGLNVVTRVSDFRNLRPWRTDSFDVVICAGNSLPLLSSRGDVAKALRSMHRVLAPDGKLILGLHNYRRPAERGETFHLRDCDPANGEVIFDIRRYEKGRTEVTYSFLRRNEGRWSIRTFTKRYLDLQPQHLSPLLTRAGFTDVSLRDFRGFRSRTAGEWFFLTARASKS